MKVFGITGWKNSGKTTLVTKLLREISGRGYTVSTIKRTHHNVDLDSPGTDSFKHREAGAQEVMLASDQRYAIMKELITRASLPDLIARMAPVDLLLVEGFKTEPHPKIECHRDGGKQPLISAGNQTIVAVATQTQIDIAVPQLDLDNVQQIADFIIEHVGLTGGGR
ncbi:molybdopterin-guanine dinucleotide biosynthesis protein B [Cognatishimia maritima]|uniref:Molybdopterin guanine dinucleotide biosynthesis accessory protein MobB n=1 Tax=Cognatishimia maritima TaxID=870908 RepID=A0A1M5RRL3_9RHOB|nr:molybdopterin-guanine dinucleotide biosynthesis protein B [Cognatishimia maritima]SHH28886.1 molybdopterin guanine dinucleotide biosynthesis accessory protein MobB [Cognatishimia maritima]